MYLADMTWYLLIVKIFPYSRDSLSYAIWCKILSINMGCSAFPWFSYCPEFWNSNAKPLKDEEFGRAFFFANNWQAIESPTAFPAKRREWFCQGNPGWSVGEIWSIFGGCHRAAVSPSVRWNMIKFAREHLRNRYMYWSVEVDPWLIRFFDTFWWCAGCQPNLSFVYTLKTKAELFQDANGLPVYCFLENGILLDVCMYICNYQPHYAPFFLIFLRSIRAFGYLGLALKTKGHSRFFIGIPVVGLN